MIASHPSIPTATYRLQFNKEFTFQAARAMVPYLAELGISHCYSSPYFRASPESTHGYDICDHNHFNEAVGTPEDYDAFVAELDRCGLQQILDFVPNHMGISEPLNGWWMDVLENGPSSIYAPYFDIDWKPVKEELESKVLLPILGDQYGRVLENGEFKLSFQEGAFYLHYYATTLPLNPRSYGHILKIALDRLNERYLQDFYLELRSILTALEHMPLRTQQDEEKILERAREKQIVKRRLDRLCRECPQVHEAIGQAAREIAGQPGDRHSFDALDALLEAQAYRLSYWRVASEEINYRRFFDVNGLAAIRVELPKVFEESHRLVFDLIKRGAVNGLRIDHVDGLWNPGDYLRQLQQHHAAAFDLGREERGLYLVVEKILSENEHLRADWPVHGTTGYDFTNQVIQVLTDPAAERSITDTYVRFSGETIRLEDLVYRSKQRTMRFSLASEINVLGHMLNRLSEKNRWYRDFTLNALTTAVREVIGCFSVYRTYVTPNQEIASADREVVERAVAAAKRRNPATEESIFDFLRDMLLMKFPENIAEAAKTEHIRFVMKFQQCTGAVMAKGLEDTAFYNFNRLVALNEVGGDPQRFGASMETFHQQNSDRQREFPHTLLTTSTHDTKRSEDVRARIATLSELPLEWRRALQTWKRLNRRAKTEVGGRVAPDANEEYLLYQTLLGTWPFQLASAAPDEPYIERIQSYMAKAMKEAKVNSSWIQPNEAWEKAVRHFVSSILSAPGGLAFRKEFGSFAETIARLGALNSLTQVALKCTVPGVPDIYQGGELWDFSLVDPDNRRPVDYDLRRRKLEQCTKAATAADLLANWQDGSLKLFVTHKLLTLRRERPEFFANSDYTPLETGGTFSNSCVAFHRSYQNNSLIVAVPRLCGRLGFPPIGDAWKETTLALPPELKGQAKELFTGRFVKLTPTLALARLFESFPLAVLWKELADRR